VLWEIDGAPGGHLASVGGGPEMVQRWSSEHGQERPRHRRKTKERLWNL
jgi:hypothetical protein